MNANELADKLEEWYNYSHENMCNEAATMLRQQQAEIEALKAKTLTGAIGSLSDDEIEVLASKHLCYQIEGSEVSGVFNFARAILKKASER